MYKIYNITYQLLLHMFNMKVWPSLDNVKNSQDTNNLFLSILTSSTYILFRSACPFPLVGYQQIYWCWLYVQNINKRTKLLLHMITLKAQPLLPKWKIFKISQGTFIFNNLGFNNQSISNEPNRPWSGPHELRQLLIDQFVST